MLGVWYSSPTGRAVDFGAVDDNMSFVSILCAKILPLPWMTMLELLFRLPAPKGGRGMRLGSVSK
jgi:hypothetical protein